MALGGIGSYGMGRYFNYQSAVSQIRLQNALSKNAKYQQAIQPVQSANHVSMTDGSSSMDFLKSYSSTMSDLMQSSNTLRQSNRSGVMNDMEVTSSDESVAVAKERYTVRSSKEMTVDVSQIAAAQESISQGVKGSAAAEGAMEFSIADAQGRTVNISVEQNYESGSTKTNREMLKEAAAQINKQSDVGVKAYIEDKDGVSTLRLKGTKTGENNSFSVSGQLGAAKGLEEASQTAQDAVYSVTSDGVTTNRKSSSNEVTIDYGRIGLTLKGAGEVTVSSHPDEEKVVSAVKDLTKSYNNALKLLNDNADRGTGVTNQLRNLVSGLASEKSLEKVGITTKKDGTLVLDEDVLKKSLKENPTLTKDILGGSYSVAQTGFNKASQAMSANAGSLIGNDLKAMQYESMNDPFNFMNMYSKNGAYNMNNYNALGLMINYLV